MFRVKLFVVAMVLAAPALAQNQLVDYINPTAVSMGIFPNMNEVVTLGAMTPVQKLRGGYLISVSLVYAQSIEMATANAFLETKNIYEKGILLNRKKGKIVGMYEYTGLDGFKHSVYRLKEIR